MRGHTAACGEDTFCAGHTGEVFGRGLDADHNHLVTVGVPFLSVVSVEHDLTAGCTGRSGQTLSDDLGLLQSVLVEYGVQQLVELLGLAAHDGSLLVNHAFTHEIHSNLHHSRTGTLAVTCLQEPQLAFLHGELHILHVAIVLLQLVLQGVQLLVELGHGFLHRGILGHTVCFADAGTLGPTLRADLGDLLRCADTGHHVFTLCVDQILAVEEVLAVAGIAAEAYAGSGGVAHVAEHHSHHADSRTPLVGNAFHLTVEDGALVHPAAEHGADGTPKLLHGIVGEVAAGLSLDGLLKQLHELLEALHGEVLVEHDALLLLHLFDDGLEGIDVFLVDGLHAEHHVAVHLHEAAVGVVHEVRILSLGHHTFSHLVVQTEVQDGVHHAGHGSAGTGAYAHEQRILHVAELRVHQLLDVSHSGVHVVLQQLDNLVLTYLVILVTGVGGDGEPGRHGHSDEVHLSQIRTLAAQCLSHLGVTFGLSVAESVNSFLTHCLTCYY